MRPWITPHGLNVFASVVRERRAVAKAVDALSWGLFVVVEVFYIHMTWKP